MSAPTPHQIIEMDGRPAFAVVPYAEYLELLAARTDGEVTLPHAVVKKVGLEGKSLVRAWREHRNLTQAQAAARMGVSQAALAQMERPGAGLRPATLAKLAAALEVDVRQLQED